MCRIAPNDPFSCSGDWLASLPKVVFAEARAATDPLLPFVLCFLKEAAISRCHVRTLFWIPTMGDRSAQGALATPVEAMLQSAMLLQFRPAMLLLLLLRYCPRRR